MIGISKGFKKVGTRETTDEIMEYQVHFGKAYAMWLNGYDKDYHRIRTYKNKQDALKCLDRANNCKWVEWTDFITKERKIKWTKKQWIQFLNRIDSDSPTPEECIYLRNEIKRKEL